GSSNAAQTAFSQAPSITQPQAAASACTTWSPRPDSASMSACSSTGGMLLSSVTTQIIRPSCRCQASITLTLSAAGPDGQVPCLIALVTNSEATITASSTRTSSFQSRSVAAVKSRAALTDS